MPKHLTRVISRPEFIALIAALMSLNALAIDIMLPALPNMGEALGVASENERQYVIAAYMLGFGIAQLAYGPLSDRFGRRAPLLIGIILYIVSAIAAVFSPNFGVLLALRFTQGIGAAGTRVIATSIVRDRYSGREMAEVMSLTFMVFMAMPVLAPSIGQILLLTGPWQAIFLFMGALAAIVSTWAFLRLPETLHPEFRRPLTVSSIVDGFRLVVSNRTALFYSLAGTFTFAALFGFISTSQQVYVEIYGLGPLFPAAFAAVAVLMAVSSFTNSRIVRRWGMRRISHGAILVSIGTSAIWLSLSLAGFMPLWLFLLLLSIIMFCFGWYSSNMNSLSMEPLGAVAGTAAAIFGFIQTVGGALMGSFIGQHFDGTVVPVTAGYFSMGVLALICILIAERGKLFGVGAQYAKVEPVADAH